MIHTRLIDDRQRDIFLSYLRQDGVFRKKIGVSDWFKLCINLNAHGLLMVNAANIANYAPSPVAKKVAAQRVQHDAKMRLRLRSLRAFDDAAARCGLSYALIKGMPFSQMLYGDAFARDSGDMDILVAQDDLAKADWAARQAGWIQPAEAYKARRALDAGTLTPEGLSKLASSFSLRSSRFLPHVTNYYYAHEDGQIDSLEVHDRFYALGAEICESMLWSFSTEVELGERPFRSVSPEFAFLLSALSLYEDSECVRPNTFTRDDMGLKTCFDVRRWLQIFDDGEGVSRVRDLACALGVEEKFGRALAIVDEVFPDEARSLNWASSHGKSAWSMSYTDKVFLPDARAESGALDIAKSFSECLKRGSFGGFSSESWREQRRLPAECGLFDTGFAFKIQACCQSNLSFAWLIPFEFERSLDSLVFQAVVLDSSSPGPKVGYRVNCFAENGAWKALRTSLGANSVDGHANKMSRGQECCIERVRLETHIELRVSFKESGFLDLGRLLLFPSVNEQIVGQLFRRCAGFDFIEEAERAMHECKTFSASASQ